MVELGGPSPLWVVLSGLGLSSTVYRLGLFTYHLSLVSQLLQSENDRSRCQLKAA